MKKAERHSPLRVAQDRARNKTRHLPAFQQKTNPLHLSIMETLHIENFAGLKDVRIEFAPITVLIGPQATGKSVISKLLFFFRKVLWILNNFAEKESKPEHDKKLCLNLFKDYFPPRSWSEGEAKIVYLVGEHRLEIFILGQQKYEKYREVRLEWSEMIYDLFSSNNERIVNASLKPQTGRGEDFELDQTAMEFSEHAREQLGSSAFASPEFIPAGRAFFSQMQAAIWRVLEAGAEIDPFLVSFGALLERSRSLLHRRGFYGKPQSIIREEPAELATAQLLNLKSDIAKILHAELETEDKMDMLRFPDGRLMQLSHASSGQQEALPLLLLLSRFTLQQSKVNFALHIEEPEAHLFPTTQREVVEMMSEVFGLQEGRMSLVITTHSPYILTSFNNLLQAGLRYQDADEKVAKKLEAIVPRRRALRPGDVTAYALEGGSAKRIMDADTHLIDAALIDQVSNELAVEFDRLLWEE